MDSTHHRFRELFDQLGLPSDNDSIRAFIEKQRPLPAHVLLPDAPCWTPAQAQLLKEQWKQDADWAEVVDQLNLALR
jgi:hypothetical protein